MRTGSRRRGGARPPRRRWSIDPTARRNEEPSKVPARRIARSVGRLLGPGAGRRWRPRPRGHPRHAQDLVQHRPGEDVLEADVGGPVEGRSREDDRRVGHAQEGPIVGDDQDQAQGRDRGEADQGGGDDPSSSGAGHGHGRHPAQEAQRGDHRPADVGASLPEDAQRRAGVVRRSEGEARSAQGPEEAQRSVAERPGGGGPRDPGRPTLLRAAHLRP